MGNQRNKILVIVGIVLVVLVGGIVFFASRQVPSNPVPTPTPIVKTQEPPVLTVEPTSTTLVASQSATFDLFLNTHGIQIDGFQFIATLDGSAIPTITDSDALTAGTQIAAASVSGLNPVTNSVVPQDSAQIIRFAMITTSATDPFSSTTPVKIASVTFMSSNPGALSLTFNLPNTRANKNGSTEETLIKASDEKFTVSQMVASASPIASASSSQVAKSATTGSSATAIACDSACLNDNDCSLGLSCINNACRNPACTASLTCQCAPGSTATASGAKTTSVSLTPTPRPTVTPRPTATPTAVASSSTTIAALPDELPQSGSMENTIILIMSGLACITLAGFLMIKGSSTS